MNAEAAQFNQLYIDFLRQYYLHKGGFLSEDEVLTDMPPFYKFGTLLSPGIQFLYRSGDLIVDNGKYKISPKAIAEIEYGKQKEKYYFDKLLVDLENANNQKKDFPIVRKRARISYYLAIGLALLELIKLLKPLWLPYYNKLFS